MEMKGNGIDEIKKKRNKGEKEISSGGICFFQEIKQNFSKIVLYRNQGNHKIHGTIFNKEILR